MTRAQAILAGAHQAHPVLTVPPKKKKGAPLPMKPHKPTAPTKPTPKSTATTTMTLVSGKAPKKVKDAWLGEGPEGVALVQDQDGSFMPVKKRRPQGPVRVATAVEVDAPGCSINPDRELHQDSMAVAVAAEMKKVYDRDLQPTAPLAVVDYDPETDELAMLQVDADDGEDEDDEAEAEDEEMDVEGEENEGGSRKSGRSIGVAKKKTLKDRNREGRRKIEDAHITKRKKEKQQRHDLSNLKQLQSEVTATVNEREARQARKQADLEERIATEPPRFGKHKFESMPVQVMTTEEWEESGGSLRKLRPTAMLAKERFKSLQRRGIIEPRRKVMKRGRKKVEFIHGERADKAHERQKEVEEVRSQVRKLKNSSKRQNRRK